MRSALIWIKARNEFAEEVPLPGRSGSAPARPWNPGALREAPGETLGAGNAIG